MYKNYFLHVIIDIVLVVIVTGTYFYFLFPSILDYFIASSSVNTHISFAHPSYPADYRDNAILLGASHNVFIGKVLAIASTKDFVGNPATQFSVEVIKNIKGNLKDTVILNQEGGMKNGVMYHIEDSTLLQPGSTYILATRYEPEGDMYTLNPHPNAHKLLSSDASLSDAELKKLADTDEKTKTLEVAYPKEHLLEADVYHANTRNEFTSLPDTEKALVQKHADDAEGQLTKGK